MKTPRVFRRNRFARHPSRSRCLCKPRRPSCVGRAFARGVLPGDFRLSTRFGRSSFQVFSQDQNTHMSCMHDLAINKQKHDTTASCDTVRKESLLSLLFRLTRVCRVWSSRTENNLQYFSRPEPSYRCHPPNTFRSGRA